MQHKILDQVLNFIEENRGTTSDLEFFKKVSEFLAYLFQIENVLISKCTIKNLENTEIIAYHGTNNIPTSTIYKIENSPFESCIYNNSCVYSKQLRTTFPENELLKKLNAESFIAVTLWGTLGEPIGLISLIDTKPLTDIKVIKDILRIIAIIVSKVLEQNLHNNILNSKTVDLNLVKVKVEESESKFKKLSNLTFEGILIHDKGIVIDVNLSFLEMFGFKHEEIVGNNITKLIYPEKFHHNIYKNRANKYTLPYEIEGIRKDGSVFPIEVEARNIIAENNKSIRVTAFRDISNRKKIEVENKKLLDAIEQSANTIIITDLKGNIEYTNPKFTELTGFKSNEVTFKNSVVLNLKPQNKKDYDDLIRTVKSGNIWKGQFDSFTKSGSLYWAQITITPLKNSKGEIINYLAILEDITEKKNDERKLKEAYEIIQKNEEYLKNILKTAKEGFFITTEKFEIVQVNNEMCKILGRTESEILNNSILNFLLSSEKVNSFKERLTAKQGIQSQKYSIELQKKNKKIVPCLVKMTTIYNENNKMIGYFAFVTNITSIKIAHKKLENKNEELELLTSELSKKNKLVIESKNRFHKLFEQSPVSLWEEDFTKVISLLNKKKQETNNLKDYLDNNPSFIDECISNLKILNVNDYTLRLLGVESKEELMNNFHKNFNKKRLETFKKELLAIASNKNEFTSETEFVKRDGELINVIIKFNLIKDFNIAIVSIINISEIKKIQHELIKAKEKAEESDRLKTEFLNNMSHEIRTPMNGILGFSNLLNTPDLSNERRNNYINIIQNSSKQLLHIIDDILEISRLGTKQVKVIKEEVCLNDMLLELFSVFDIKAKENKTPLYLRKSLSDKQSTIFSDKTKLNKIISNLLENALKFTNQGFIEFGYHIINESTKEVLEIYVKDSGVGIEPEKHQLIFERFSQAEKELSKNVGGLGLGLSIAKENTELLGGRISVESKITEGATFLVKIPYKPVNINDKNTIQKINSLPKEKKHTILIAEDEEINYLFLEIIIIEKMKLNCNILHAKDGVEAVEIYKKNPNIEMVLMDIRMPRMNGYEATKQLKKIQPNLPIIALTAYSTPEDKQKAAIAGCDDFISKPINKDKLKNIMMRTIDKRVLQSL